MMLSSSLLYSHTRASLSPAGRPTRVLAQVIQHGRSHHHTTTASMVTQHQHDGDDDDPGNGADHQSSYVANNETIVNNFHLLGLPTTFPVDEQRLKSNYLKLMVQSHPDKLASQQNSSNTTGQQQQHHDANNKVASLVTKAFDVLQKPHTRAVHLLELEGKPLEEGSKSELVGTDFLLEIMELRERIQNTTNNDTLQQMRTSCRQHTDETCHQLAQAFAAHDLDRALTLTAQLQYWNRVDETIRDKMDTLE